MAYADSSAATELGTEFRDHREVIAALEALSEEDLGRLARAGRIWIRDLGLDAIARDADDLVSEAIVRTTGGQRRWKVGVDLMRHLREAMRSIVDSWDRSARRRLLSGGAEVRSSDFLAPAGEDGDGAEALDRRASPEPDAPRKLCGMDEVRAFSAHFEGDEDAHAVLEGIWWEMEGPEIREKWGLTQHRYDAARRRIRRHANKEGIGHGH